VQKYVGVPLRDAAEWRTDRREVDFRFFSHESFCFGPPLCIEKFINFLTAHSFIGGKVSGFFLFFIGVLFANALATADSRGGKVLNLPVPVSDGLLFLILNVQTIYDMHVRPTAIGLLKARIPRHQNDSLRF
jgi:hypothetical protein